MDHAEDSTSPASYTSGVTSRSCSTCGGTCGGNCGGQSSSTYVYALGRIEPRFTSPAVEKEFSQVLGRSDTAGLTDRQALHSVFLNRQNRYLARQLCWVFAIEGIETYVLIPRESADLDTLMESVRPTPRPTDVDVVIGVRGPTAPPERCNGLTLPTVAFSQLYSFDIDSLVASIPRSKDGGAKEVAPAAEEIFLRVMQMTDNAGSTDQHRALNYLAVRYPAIYAKTAEQFRQNCALSGVEARPSPLGGARKIMNVVFAYTNRTTDVTEKFLVRVDITEEFPFLVTKLSPYFEH
jgi:hypothetical protein